MSLVNLGNRNNGQHDEENAMPEDEITSKHAKLGDFAKVFSCWLRHGMPPHRVPFTRPESDIGCVRLEFSGECQGNDELIYESLDGTCSDHS